MGKKYSNIKERVLYLAETKEDNKQIFFRKTELKYSNFTGASKETALSSDAVGKILLIYPDVDLYWLITGSSKSAEKFILNEDDEPDYKSNCKLCDEKDKRIKLLEKHIEELTQDKQDFKTLLGLKNGKTA